MGMTALIVGSAPCARNDIAHARIRRPCADTIAVKFSVAIVHARVAVSHHAEHAETMKRIHRKVWGDEVEVHMPKKVVKPQYLPHVDKQWPELVGVGGTSAWGAARMARQCLGYDEAILCGCPLWPTEPGQRYHDAEVFEAATAAGVRTDRGEPFANPDAVRQYQTFIQSDIDRGLAGGITSMSGWTRKALGAPDGI